jgi:hypothetical protein
MLSSDLFDLARDLNPEPGDPLEDVKSRRVISTVYYAVFHLLCETLADQLAPDMGGVLRFRIQRALNHADVKEVCVSLANSRLPRFLEGTMAAVPQQAKVFADAFIELQERRHVADYDAASPHTAYDAGTVLLNGSEAFSIWRQLRETPDGRAIAMAFLAARQFKGK